MRITVFLRPGVQNTLLSHAGSHSTDDGVMEYELASVLRHGRRGGCQRKLRLVGVGAIRKTDRQVISMTEGQTDGGMVGRCWWKAAEADLLNR